MEDVFFCISGMASLNKHPVVFREGDWVPMGVFNMGSCRFLRREPLELVFEATCRTAHQWTVLAMPSTTPRPSDRIPTHQDGGHVSLEFSSFFRFGKCDHQWCFKQLCFYPVISNQIIRLLHLVCSPNYRVRHISFLNTRQIRKIQLFVNLQKKSQNCNLQCFSYSIQKQLIIQNELPGIGDQWDIFDTAKKGKISHPTKTSWQSQNDARYLVG